MTLPDEPLREATEARDRMLERQRELERARADYHHAIRRLNAEGGSTREIAEALGLSHQRVHQIVCGEESAADRERRLVHLFPRRGRSYVSRFSQPARRAVVRAQQESAALGHGHVGTEHLLLAMLTSEGGVAATALAALGVERDAVVAEIVRRVGRVHEEPPAGRNPFTPKAKQVLELALREARDLKHDYIGVEHVLLGIVRDRENLACEILDALGAGPGSVRSSVIGLLAA
jgi:hypothetical protein